MDQGQFPKIRTRKIFMLHSTVLFSPEVPLPQIFVIMKRSKIHAGPQLQTPALLLVITLLDDDMSCSGISHCCKYCVKKFKDT